MTEYEGSHSTEFVIHDLTLASFLYARKVGLFGLKQVNSHYDFVFEQPTPDILQDWLSGNTTSVSIQEYERARNELKRKLNEAYGGV